MKKLLLIIMLALGLFAGSVITLLTTEPGLRLGIQAISRLSGGMLRIEKVSGTALSGVVLEKASLQTAEADISIFELELGWQPERLQWGELVIGRLHGQGIDIRLRSRAEKGSKVQEPWKMPDPEKLALPLGLFLDKVTVENLTVWQEDGNELIALDSIRFGLNFAAGKVVLRELEVASPQLALSASGTLDGGAGGVMAVTGHGGWNGPEFPGVEASFLVSGSLEKLVGELTTTLPAPARVLLTMENLDTEPRWQAELSLDKLSLPELATQLPEGLLSLAATGAGDMHGAAAQLTGRFDSPDLDTIKLDISVSRQGEKVRIEKGEVRTDFGMAALSEVELTMGDGLSWQGGVKVRGFDPGRFMPGVVTGVDGDFQTSGTFLADRKLDASLVFTDLQMIDLEGRQYTGSGRIELADGVLRVGDIILGSAGSTLKAEGEARFAAPMPTLPVEWQARLELADFNPAMVLADYPGLLSGSFSTEGAAAADSLAFTVHVDRLDGALRDYPLSGQGVVRYDQGLLEFEDVRFASGNSRVEISGMAGESIDLQVALISPDVGEMLAGASGVLELQGSLKGSRELPEAELAIAVDHLSYQDVAVERVSGRLAGSPALDRPVKIELVGQGVRYGGHLLEKLTFSASGSGGDHTLELDLQSDLLDLALAGKGHMVALGRWDGEVMKGVVQADRFGKWQQRGKGHLSLSADGAEVVGLCLVSDGETVCAEGSWAGEEGVWRGDLSWHDLQLGRLDAFILLSNGLHGSSEGSLAASGNLAGVQDGTSHIEVRDFAIGGEGRAADWELLDIGTAVVDVTLAESTLSASLSVLMKDKNRLTARAKVQEAGRFDQDYRQSPLSGAIEITADHLGFVAPLTNYYVYPTGTLQGTLALSGSPLAPKATGPLRLMKGEIAFPTFGAELDDVRFRVEAEGTTLNLWGEGISGPGRLYADGSLRFSMEGVLGEFNFTGEDIDTFNLHEYVIRTTPDLRLVFDVDGGALFGDLLVPHAVLTPSGLSNSVTESGDVLYLDEQESDTGSGWNFKTVINVRLGDDVTVNAHGLTGSLRGELEVQRLHGALVTGRGELVLRDGAFTIYGRSLDIVRGRVFFGGGPIEDPGIDVRAQKIVADQTAGPNGVKVGVDVSGTADNLDFSLFSDPYMDESDILAYMVIGRSMSATSSGDENILNSAAMALGLNRGNRLIQGLTSILPVDDVYFEGETSGDRLSLVVGKKLTDDLFIGYDHNFFDQRGEVTIRYEIGRGFYVESRTSAEATGADLLFSFER